MWLCLCDCGTKRPVNGGNLRKQLSLSCGCASKAIKHGHARSSGRRSSEYNIWAQMLWRCDSPKAAFYNRYGGRGIKVCDRWRTFANFIADVGRRPSHLYTLDRLDVNGNYESGNCRWATAEEQMQNQRRTKLTPQKIIAIRAVATSLNRHELAEKYGVCPHMIDNVSKGKAWKNIGGELRPRNGRNGSRLPVEFRGLCSKCRTNPQVSPTRRYCYSCANACHRESYHRNKASVSMTNVSRET